MHPLFVGRSGVRLGAWLSSAARQPRLRVGCILGVLALLGCGKISRQGRQEATGAAAGGVTGEQDAGRTGTGADGGEGWGAGGAAGSGARAGAGASDVGGNAGEGGSDSGGATVCSPEAPPDAPIRRLNRFEYQNSLRELFGKQSWASTGLPLDPYEDALAPPSAALVQAQWELARDLARRVTETESATTAFIGCDITLEGETACRERFIADFVARAFRRPLANTDVESFTNAFDAAVERGGFNLGVREVVQITLQSPEFLYLPEFGETTSERGQGWARPAPYETASRLSYFLWGAPPDAALLAAASEDALRTPDELEAQALRMLADERALRAVDYFYVRLLRLDHATYPAAGRADYPTFTPEVASQLLGETTAFVEDVTFASNGDFRALLTAPYTFVNGPLAAFYGIPGVSGDQFRRVSVAPNRRGGLFTQASFLASTALGPFTFPSERGLRIATSLLCANVPRHPVEPTVPEPLPPNMTTRQRYAAVIPQGACAACHEVIDPVGFAFEHYDAAGLYRDTENGVPIDSGGIIPSTDAAGPVGGAIELTERLAGSEDARRCFVQNWFAFAHARTVTPADACFLAALDREFADAGENLKRLLVEIVRNEAFLYRPEVAP